MSLDLQEDFEAIVTEQINRFVKWAGENWKPDESDELEMRRSGATAEYLRGYRTALESLPLALQVWIEDGGPR